ncbi:MAG: 50S ribosomal protein L22 [Gaiellaceae bacterium]
MATIDAGSSVRAEARYVRAAPRKAQLVVDQIRGRTVPEARAVLAFMTRDAANDVRKVLDSAVANAEANHGLAGDELFVTAAYVGAGPTLKRWRARARGRVGRIRKRTCHITLALALPSGEAIPELIERPAPTSTPLPAEPVAEEEAVAEEAPAEEKPKRARAPRKKAEPAEAKAAADAEKPKPKRARAAKPKAEGETEKPKTERKPRAKKKTETEGSED